MSNQGVMAHPPSADRAGALRAEPTTLSQAEPLVPLRDSAKFWRALAISMVVGWFLQPLAWRLWGWRHLDVTLSDGTRVCGSYKVERGEHR